eukprot:CAMPEP_0115117214 /NCGR_PEP_ID=MMETSP0227-20121206/43745_1 /TAXON_ID=89957 /ORGANISM="Polarella glacialis, Strain CCMP 1383" /LENGTH=305 /DNA_ID=CAMNT_0002518215 /DNA_START=16 /DNA_END=933 /DNA_ORIENTATION=+
MSQRNDHRAGRAAMMLGVGTVWAFCFSSTLPGPAAVGAQQAAGDTSEFITKVVGAAAQGAVAACVAAVLSAFTEPIVNRLLVERCTVSQAINSVKLQDCLKFFLTTFPTNMLKFPIFEVINMMLAFTSLSGSLRGIINGALFCTIMLPVTNYRFRKSMNLPIEPALLYQAYPPTLLRDIVYGWARGIFGGLLYKLMPGLATSFVGKAFLFGLTVTIACILSSPFNEWRGFWLQQPGKKLPMSQFFKPERYVRSTGVGATIMGISLMVGALLVPAAETLFGYFMANRIVGLVTLVAMCLGYSKLIK